MLLNKCKKLHIFYNTNFKHLSIIFCHKIFKVLRNAVMLKPFGIIFCCVWVAGGDVFVKGLKSAQLSHPLCVFTSLIVSVCGAVVVFVSLWQWDVYLCV